MTPEMEKRRADLIKSMGKKWLLHPSNAPQKIGMIKTSGDGVAAVQGCLVWISIAEIPPPEGRKMLLINEQHGVACVGIYREEHKQYWTHWQGLPRFER